MDEHQHGPTGNHPVINVTTYCPYYSNKREQISCGQCTKANSCECASQTDCTHITEDVSSILDSDMGEEVSPAPLVDAEQRKPTEDGEKCATVKRDIIDPSKEIVQMKPKIIKQEQPTPCSKASTKDGTQQAINFRGCRPKVISSTSLNGSLRPVYSMRQVDSNLTSLKCNKGNRITLKRASIRFYYLQSSIWCPCYRSNRIDVYSTDGKRQRSLKYSRNKSVQALHPISDTQVLLAAESGLYVYDTKKQAIIKSLLHGKFKDVHASGTDIIALEKNSDSGDLVHVFNTTDPPTHTHSFCVNHSNAESVMLHNQLVYLSTWGATVSVYTMEGEMISQYGQVGPKKRGEMTFPILCAGDTEGSLMVADCHHHRLQILKASGEFHVVEGIDLEFPMDVVIVGGDMYVLHNFNSIQIYKLQ